MSDKTQPDDQSRQLEEIVAYLDGELSPQESAQVEQRLASDETYRQKLQSLQRAWTALDELPAATLDDRFAQTTMEMIVATARSDVKLQTQAMPAQRRKQRLSTMLLVTAAVLLGALAFRLVW
jgi:anti-sigma factor RsiW